MTKPNTHCTCGKELKHKLEYTPHPELLHAILTDQGRFCMNTSCHKYLLLQVNEIEVNEDEELSTKYFNSF
jgi:hypothetical protein